MGRVAAGLGWTSLAAAVNALVQLGVVAVLARQLEPAAFGLLAMAVVATRFVACFAQWGMAQTLVQRAELSSAHLSAAVVLAAAASSALAAGLALAAPTFAAAFHTPELTRVLRVYAWTLPMAALSALPMALLRRAAQHATASSIEVISYAVGYGGVGIAAAMAGWGVWSLVAASLAQQALLLLLGASLARYQLCWPIPAPAWRELLGRGSGYSLISFLEFLWSNLDSLVIGRALGPALLGVFNRAQLLASLPVEQAVNAGSKVMFPALAGWQHDRTRLVEGFWLMLAGSGLVSVALAAGIAAAAPDLVAALLGPAWGAAAPLVAALAIGVPATFVYVACGITLDSLALLRGKLILQALTLIVKALALWLALAHGLVWLAAAVVAAEWLRAAAGLRLISHALQLDAAILRGLLAAMLLLGLAMYAAVWSAHQLSLGWGLGWAMSLPLRLGAQVLAGAAVLAGAWSLAWRRQSVSAWLYPLRRQLQQSLGRAA